MAETESEPIQSRGLNELLYLEHIVINQLANGLFGGNKYEITSSEGMLLLVAKQQRSALRMSPNITVVDSDHQEVIMLRKKARCCEPVVMQVWLCGQLVSLIRQKMTWFDPVLYINDAEDEPVLRIKGTVRRGVTQGYYELQTLNKEAIGTIRREWKGWRRELFFNRDTFTVQFPGDLDLRYKAAVLGACVFLDFLRYENR